MSAAHATEVHVEQLIDCPFSLAMELAHVIFPVLQHPSGGVRIPYRAFAMPLRGAFAHPVAVEFRRRSDATEPGRSHDEVAFTWDARSRWLPNFDGFLRFRIESSKTRVILDGSYVPPFGKMGAFVDRFIGNRVALATSRDLVSRLGGLLEARWTAERA